MMSRHHTVLYFRLHSRLCLYLASPDLKFTLGFDTEPVTGPVIRSSQYAWSDVCGADDCVAQ